MYYYWGDGCPVCADQEDFLAALTAQYSDLRIVSRELWLRRDHHASFRAMASAHGIRASSVPTIFLGGEAFVGDSPALRRRLEARIEYCLAGDCPDSGSMTAPTARGAATTTPSLTLPLIGTVDLAVQPLVASTVLIALIDGFNPCSLWVLTVLLALVIHSRSRRRVLLVGLSFLVTTAAVYGLFIAGVFSMLAFVVYLGWVQWIVGLMALGFGLVNVKDYFWFQRGLSLTIPASQKPGIYRRMRGLLDPGHSTATLVGATILMALGVALVELPCTAGFPVIWSGLVAERAPGFMTFIGLLALYLLLYLLIELILFIGALRTLSVARFEERHGRILKLFGGMIMLALGLTLLVAPELMNRLDATLLVFASAFLAAGLTLLAHRMFRARAQSPDGSL
ncbi:MAG: thioredoxin [Chromatiales bacterium]|nr:thioredoxin [Chromatiales bacterium]